MLVGLMMVGCGEEVEVPDMIACVCGKGISSKSEACPNCGHPTPDSVVANKESQELARKRGWWKRQELITKRVKLLIDKRENFVTDKKLEMLWVKPGAFMMGDTGEPHQVTLTKGFYLGKYEVTQAQWERVMGNNPSNFKGVGRPVGKVSWNDAVEFCKKLTELEKKAGRVPQGMSYQLPTEAQWEYACRAGTTSVYSWGDTITKTNANYRRNVVKTTSVGKYPANPWGFHDMHGNVSEWCADWYGDYPSGAVTDSEGPASGSARVMRGGSCYNTGTGSKLRSARRNGITPSFCYNGLGFRVGFQSSK